MVVKDAYENARFLCDQYYMSSPALEIIEHNGKLLEINNSLFLLNHGIKNFYRTGKGSPN